MPVWKIVARDKVSSPTGDKSLKKGAEFLVITSSTSGAPSNAEVQGALAAAGYNLKETECYVGCQPGYYFEMSKVSEEYDLDKHQKQYRAYQAAVNEDQEERSNAKRENRRERAEREAEIDREESKSKNLICSMSSSSNSISECLMDNIPGLRPIVSCIRCFSSCC